MRTLLMLLAALFLGSTAASFAQIKGEDASSILGPHSLQSINYPDRYARHAYFMGELSEIASPVDRADSTFVIVPGLNGAPGSVSLESINYPGRFLRHQNFRIHLSQNDGSDLFRNDASFRPRMGLANERAVSFESVNYPGHFIRHSSFHLGLNANDDSGLFRLDATFLVTPPNDQSAADAAQTFACYWLEPGPSGAWQAMPHLATLTQCYEQDSCSGGLGRSGGGCYKWAPGPNAPGVRW